MKPGNPVPVATYRLQLSRALPFVSAKALVPYLDCAGHQRRVSVADPRRRAEQHAWLRHQQSLGAESGTGIARGSARAGRGAGRARDGARHGLRAQSHGQRSAHERVVVGRARERAGVALRALLRHRLAAGEAGASRQSAAADPRRSIRCGTGARRAAAAFSGWRAGSHVFRSRPAHQSAPGTARSRARHRSAHRNARRRQRGSPRVSCRA